jgi:Peptidase family S51
MRVVRKVSFLPSPPRQVLARRVYYLVFLSILPILHALSTPSLPAQRHICLFDAYSNVRGPYLSALVDQLTERAGHVTTDAYDIVICRDSSSSDSSSDSSDWKNLQHDLPNARFHELQLSHCNPLSLEEQMDQWQPTVVWVTGTNAFLLRYELRTSGLDRWVERYCVGVSATCVYIGEGAGAICAGASLQVARHFLHQDPKVAPEPQFFGMGLLGQEKTIAFSTLETEEEQEVRFRHHDFLDATKLSLLKPEQVYVWSQSSDGDDMSVSSFIYLPNQRGMMEQMSSPPPLPPVMETEKEGVACFGEPAVDPSRQMQSSTIGDSEWMEG